MDAFFNAVFSWLFMFIDYVGAIFFDIINIGEPECAFTDLLPLFAIGVSVSVLMLGIKAIRSFIWGS